MGTDVSVRLQHHERIYLLLLSSIASWVSVSPPTDKPTAPDDDTKAIRRTEDGTTWEIVDDFRGQSAYSTDTGEARTIDYLGALLAGWTLLAPQTKCGGTQWVTDRGPASGRGCSRREETEATSG